MEDSKKVIGLSDFEKGRNLLHKSYETSSIEKGGTMNHKYFKREGTPGNYTYYYTEQAYKDAKAGKVTMATLHNDLLGEQIKKELYNPQAGDSYTDKRTGKEFKIRTVTKDYVLLDDGLSLGHEKFQEIFHKTPSKKAEVIKKQKYQGLSPEQLEKIKEVKPDFKPESSIAPVVITFSSQEEMNLWSNEMSGQISDGQWENSRNTEWIWNADFKLGDETKVELADKYHTVGKKSFPLNGELKDIVGQRAMEEAGFKDMKSMSEAWKKINEAIGNVKYNEVLGKNREANEIKLKKQKENRIKNFKSELAAMGFNSEYDWRSELKIGKIDGTDVKITVDPKSITESDKVKTKVEFYGEINPLKDEVYINKNNLKAYSLEVLNFLTNINSMK